MSLKESTDRLLTALQRSDDELRIAVRERHYIFGTSAVMYDLLLKAEAAIIAAKTEARRLHVLQHPKREYTCDSITGHLLTIREWNEGVRRGTFNQMLGIGYWCLDGKESRDEVFETDAEDASHVSWYGNDMVKL